MADPKYADLPGIALDEPDVYETNELPEADQPTDFYEETSDSIERICISADEAFNKFRNKTLNSGKVDFSDRLSQRLRTGYDLQSCNWELVQQGMKETPMQKYQRLQCEMQELLKEVNSIKNDKNETTDVLITSTQVEESLKKLMDIKLEETLGKEAISNMLDPQKAQLKQLNLQLNNFKELNQSKPESDKSIEGIEFKLKYRPEQAKLVQTARMAELEKRLHRLENVLGASTDKLSRLSTVTAKDGLLQAAQHLSATASLLDSAQLDHIEGRLTALTQKINGIEKKKEEQENDTEEEGKIKELYDIVKCTESLQQLLPRTVERLKSLEGLHCKATDFAKTMAQVELMQTEMGNSLENNKALLIGVQDSFSANLEEINKTVVGLDARIKAITKNK